MVQDIIDQCELDTKGIYTSVGTYNHKEFFQLIDKLSDLNSLHKDDVLFSFGDYFLKVLVRSYPQFFIKKDVFEFLVSIDNYIHPTVLKIYQNKNEMKLIYHSSRKMSKFASGMIIASGKYFKQELIVTEEERIDDGEKVVLCIKCRIENE